MEGATTRRRLESQEETGGKIINGEYVLKESGQTLEEKTRSSSRRQTRESNPRKKSIGMTNTKSTSKRMCRQQRVRKNTGRRKDKEFDWQ